MPTEPSKPFDPIAQFAELQSLWMNALGPYRSLLGNVAMPLEYEMVDPLVQEVAILATMHNMASMLQNPTALKTAINVELAERSKRLAAKTK